MARRLRAEGVVAGVPDLFIPGWRLWVEMKRIDSRPSQNQKTMIHYLESVGYTVIVGYGARDASEKVINFFQSMPASSCAKAT